MNNWKLNAKGNYSLTTPKQTTLFIYKQGEKWRWGSKRVEEEYPTYYEEIFDTYLEAQSFIEDKIDFNATFVPRPDTFDYNAGLMAI